MRCVQKLNFYRTLHFTARLGGRQERWDFIRWRVTAYSQWHHNGRDCVSNRQPHHCLLKRLFRLRSKKTSKLRVTGLCAGNSPVTGEFPAQMASNAENVPIWWRHHLFSDESRFSLYQDGGHVPMDATLCSSKTMFQIYCTWNSCFSWTVSCRGDGLACLESYPCVYMMYVTGNKDTRNNQQITVRHNGLILRDITRTHTHTRTHAHTHIYLAWWITIP